MYNNTISHEQLDDYFEISAVKAALNSTAEQLSGNPLYYAFVEINDLKALRSAATRFVEIKEGGA